MQKLRVVTLVALASLSSASAFSQMRPHESVLPTFSSVYDSGTIRSATAPKSGDVDSEVTAAINKHFNASVEAVTQFKPFYLTGDLNADGAEDLIAVVQLKVERAQLPKDVKVINPFGFEDITRPNQSSTGSGEGVALCFAILHGGKGGWRANLPATRYLLLGGAPIQILDHELARSDQNKNLMSVVPVSRTRRSKYSAYRIPQTARGAWILVGTMVGDGFIFWDGKTYRFYDSPDD